MARMNLRLRRDAPGVSVFWMILGVGAVVLLVVGLYVYASGRDTQVEPEGSAVITEEGDEAPGTTGFSEGEVAEPETPPAMPEEADGSVPQTDAADDPGEAEPEDADDEVSAPPAAVEDGEANDEQERQD